MLFRSYGSGVNTGGTAEDWYKKGVASSIRVMNEIALEAQSETAFSGNGEAEINAYLADPDVQLNGINDLRSEEHTSELQSLMRISYAVYCFKKKTTYIE